MAKLAVCASRCGQSTPNVLAIWSIGMERRHFTRNSA